MAQVFHLLSQVALRLADCSEPDSSQGSRQRRDCLGESPPGPQQCFLSASFLAILNRCHLIKVRKRERVQKCMGHKVPWKIVMLIYLPATSRPLIFLQKEAVLSPSSFATTHLTAFILNFYLPLTSRPMKWRTLSQRPRRRGNGYQKWARSLRRLAGYLRLGSRL